MKNDYAKEYGWGSNKGLVIFIMSSVGLMLLGIYDLRRQRNDN